MITVRSSRFASSGTSSSTSAGPSMTIEPTFSASAI